jgi:hypothetical protein
MKRQGEASFLSASEVSFPALIFFVVAAPTVIMDEQPLFLSQTAILKPFINCRRRGELDPGLKDLRDLLSSGRAEICPRR